MKLVKLSQNYQKQLNEMLDEWTIDLKENGGNNSPSAIFKNDYHDFDNYLNNLEHQSSSKDFVADSVYFLYDEEEDIFIGAINLRHELNDYLLKYGGHLGDGIRPSQRGKGYGTMIIHLALQKAKELGINKVLMTCDSHNIASAKAIINNGGILENEILDSEGHLIQRYWLNNY